MGAVQKIEEIRRSFSQPQFDFLHSKAKYTAAVAGFGSGKTHVALNRIMANMFESPDIDQAYLAPTYSLIRDIFYPAIDVLLPELGLDYKINKSENKVHISGLGDIICRTMDNPEMIIGWQAADAVMDEFDVLNMEKAKTAFRKVSARLRQKNPTGRINQLFITTTPEGFKATYEMFKKNPLPNSNLIQMSTYSNQKNLPADYIQELMNQYPAQLIEAYLMGNFVNLTSGAVYYAYDREAHDTYYKVRDGEPLNIGMDFNVNKMAAIVHVRRKDEVCAVDEFVGYRDTPDIIRAIKETYPDHLINVYPDASGENKSSKGATESDISMLRDAGFNIYKNKSNPLIKNRVASMNNAFEKGYYRVNQRTCPEYCSSLEQQVYTANGVPDKTMDIDHPLDAAGYFIHYRFPIIKRVIQRARMIGS